MSKPSWDDAPDWANYLAMDVNGKWWWFEHEPALTIGSWLPIGGRVQVAKGPMVDYSETLEERPD